MSTTIIHDFIPYVPPKKPPVLPVIEDGDNGDYIQIVGDELQYNPVTNELPSVTSSDNGKLLGVTSGAWGKVDAPTELPDVTGSDNGKFLGVVKDGSTYKWDKVDNPYKPSTVSSPVGFLTLTLSTLAVSLNNASETKPKILAALGSGDSCFMKVILSNSIELGCVCCLGQTTMVGGQASYTWLLTRFNSVNNTLTQYFISSDYSATTWECKKIETVYS